MKDKFFYNLPSVNKVLEELRKNPASSWEKKGQQKVIELANFVLRTVPAYKQFLKDNNSKANNISDIEGFKKLPISSKENYLKKYNYKDLFPYGDLSDITTISATSGSTGEPFYLPRGEEQDKQYEHAAEIFLKNQFESSGKSTLGIIGFGLGIWIGGMFTYKIFNKIAARGSKISLLPVGPNKDLYLKSLKKFGQFYDQILLMGYPPFIKDIIDEAADYGINWKDYNIKILTATESFSEEFRDYLAKKAGVKNIYTDIINIYGTVELGTMAHETALTTLIRKIAIKHARVFSEIFGSANRLPTLAQYYPYMVHFEEEHGEILGSGYGSSIPLLRYRFPDRGGVLPFDVMMKRLSSAGVDIMKEAKKQKIDKSILKLPFVYVYERSDMSTTLFGINIYSEYIKHALQNKDTINSVTGKFTMITKTDKEQNQFLEINIELKKGIKPSSSFASTVQKSVIKSLLEKSTEYNYLHGSGSATYRKRLRPKIVLWPHEDLSYFGGGKQRWTIKQPKNQ